MNVIRAIFVGDVIFDQCPVFELNKKTGYFEMLIDKGIRYHKETIEEDEDFLIFEVKNDIVTLTNKI